MSDYTPTKDRIVSWLMEGAYTGQGADHRAEAFDTWLAEHDAKVRAEERERCADRDPSADEVEAFREEWKRADDEGDAGNRVRRGLIAAQEVRDAG